MHVLDVIEWSELGAKLAGNPAVGDLSGAKVQACDGGELGSFVGTPAVWPDSARTSFLSFLSMPHLSPRSSLRISTEIEWPLH